MCGSSLMSPIEHLTQSLRALVLKGDIEQCQKAVDIDPWVASMRACCIYIRPIQVNTQRILREYPVTPQ